jgi:hypothetical protein
MKKVKKIQFHNAKDLIPKTNFDLILFAHKLGTAIEYHWQPSFLQSLVESRAGLLANSNSAPYAAARQK